MSFFHGLQFAESSTGVRPIKESSTAVIGLVATATADAGAASATLDAAFPLDRPVLVTDVRAAISTAGSGGTLAQALGAIADQGSPTVVVVRVAVGVAGDGHTADEATTLHVVGGSVAGRYTGIQALLAAQGVVGVQPKILGAPGLDNQDVVTALTIVARRLRGFVYAACHGCATVAEAVTYRAKFGDRELMLIWPDATGWSGQAIASALGLRAMIDEQVGWHKSLSNVLLSGFTGITADVHFDIRDMSTDAGVLNAAEVTTIVAANGYRFWGNRTCSADPYFVFETAVRTAQAVQDDLAAIEAPFVDQPMTVGLVRDLVESGAAYLRQQQSEGRLIGAKMFFDGSANPAEMLAAGKLTLETDYTPVAPLEGLTTNLRITSAYYSGFGDNLSRATDS